MKILTVSDLHQSRSLYAQLGAVVRTCKPDLVCAVGDFLDYGGGDLPIGEAAAFLAQIADTYGCEIVFSQGNHELFDEEFGAFERAWEKLRPLRMPCRSVCQFGDLVIVGFPAFACDDWATWLPVCMKALGPRGRMLWLMHEPPTLELATDFFHCQDFQEAVERYEPLIVVSGHDHNTPLERGVWKCKMGQTTCVNVGQRAHEQGAALCYCTLRIEFGAAGPQLLNLQRHG